MTNEEIDHVDPQDLSRENSEKGTTDDVVSALAGDRDCYWNDKRYSDGATVCDAKVKYKCWSGKWVDIGQC
jgi:Protein of unknown function (DUF1496)